MTHDERNTMKVIAGPAGHWYALFSDPQFGETLIGLPMLEGDDADSIPPPHPGQDVEPMIAAGWYEITDPAPETDDAALIAKLKD